MPKKYCPPNTLCLDTSSFVFVALLLVFAVIFYEYVLPIIHKKNNNVNNVNKENSIKEEKIIINLQNDKDDLDEEPGRRHTPRRGMPINIRTRGEPPKYDQIGFLTSESNPNDIKPLFGRQTYRGSSLWNYYTALDSHLSTKIPIQKNRNCIDTHGCSEINSGDTINISGSSENYKVELYPYNEIRYIPYV